MMMMMTMVMIIVIVVMMMTKICLHGDKAMGKVIVVMGVADPMAFSLLRLNLDGEHAREGGEGGVKVG